MSTVKETYKLIIPKARNVLDFITESFVYQFRQDTEVEVEIPSLIKRAKMLVKEEGVLLMKQEKRNDN